MAKICTQCGAELSDDIRFCTECGAPLPEGYEDLLGGLDLGSLLEGLS